MTFNPDSDISGGKVSKRGRNTGIAVGGGGGLVVLAVILISAFTGVDLTGLVGGGDQAAQTGDPLTSCQTGQNANDDVECRMQGAYAALDAYWVTEAPAIGVAYASPQPIQLFSGSVSTGCGGASSASGPFYCPPDKSIYIDTAFFEQLKSQFGASGGPLAQLYIVGHEWGHHIQGLSGTLAGSQDGQTGEDSNQVKIELQADCFAGAWIGDATEVVDENGVPFLEPITDAQLKDALNAAAAVGDDRIQEASSGQVNPDSWTHGSSAERQQWFATGYNKGAAACDTGLGL